MALHTLVASPNAQPASISLGTARILRTEPSKIVVAEVLRSVRVLVLMHGRHSQQILCWIPKITE